MTSTKNNIDYVLYVLAVIAYKAEDFQDAVWYCEKAQKISKIGTLSQDVMELYGEAHSKLEIELKSQLLEARELLKKDEHRMALDLCDKALRRKIETVNYYQQEFTNIRRKVIVKSRAQHSGNKTLPILCAALALILALGFYTWQSNKPPFYSPIPTHVPFVDKETPTFTVTIEKPTSSTNPTLETTTPTVTIYATPTIDTTPTTIFYRIGNVTEDSVRLRTGPGTFYNEQNVKSQLSKYAKVQILESVLSDNRGKDDCPNRIWYRIRLPDEYTEAYICAYFVK